MALAVAVAAATEATAEEEEDSFLSEATDSFISLLGSFPYKLL